MAAQPDPEVIAGSSIGTELEHAGCVALAGAMTARHLRDGEVLIEEGHVDNALHLVVKGKLAVTRLSGGGDEVTLHLLGTGDIAGAMGFLDGVQHSATLRALGETETYGLQREALESLLESHPVVVYRVMRAIVRTVHAILLRMNLQQIELTNYVTKQHGRY